MPRQFKWSSLFIILSLFFANAVYARDISNEQRAASEARDRYNQAVSDDASLTKQVADQESRVATEQTRLKTLQDKQTENKSKLESAKTDLDTKVQTLEKVWEERNKN